jgi:hypothetical protein
VHISLFWDPDIWIFRNHFPNENFICSSLIEVYLLGGAFDLFLFFWKEKTEQTSASV